MEKANNDFKLFMLTAAVMYIVMFLAKFIYFEFIYRNL
jgi:hypothetical protein